MQSLNGYFICLSAFHFGVRCSILGVRYLHFVFKPPTPPGSRRTCTLHFRGLSTVDRGPPSPNGSPHHPTAILDVSRQLLSSRRINHIKHENSRNTYQK